jgi:DNA-binding transcriptional ArsR family regulator
MFHGIPSLGDRMAKESNVEKGSLNGVIPYTVKGSGVKRYLFTDLQIEAAKLRSQGFSYSQIGKQLNKKPHHISQTLKEFRESGTADRIRQAFFELQNAHYWEKRLKRADFLVVSREAEEKMLREGLWPFSSRLVPAGYTLTVWKKLVLQPEKAQIMKRVFMRVGAGEPPKEVAVQELHGVNPSSIYQILRNPIYKGYICFGDKIFPGEHESIVDEETWDRVQKIISIKRPAIPRFGFRRTPEGVAPDNEKIETLREVCRLRRNKKSIHGIAQTFTVSDGVIRHILREPIYRDIVGAKLWDEARRINLESGASMLGKFRRGLEDRTRATILQHLLNYGPSTTSQMVKATGLCESTVHLHLHKFKSSGLVDREPKRFGKWFLKSTLKGLQKTE